VHFLQIWIIPEAAGLEPGYEEKEIARHDTGSGLTLIGSRDGREGAITIHQDVELYVAHLNEGETARHQIKKGRIAWVQVARGSLNVNGETLHAGDGAAIKDEDVLVFDDAANAEALVFDMAA
jgi:redox-sensitive bicupin YhaK (pirin superfamily)